MTELRKPLAKFLREYLPHERGVSPHTIEAQITTFRMLTTFAAGLLGTTPCRLTIENLDTATLLAFLDHLETERNNNIRTRNTRLATIIYGPPPFCKCNFSYGRVGCSHLSGLFVRDLYSLAPMEFAPVRPYQVIGFNQLSLWRYQVFTLAGVPFLPSRLITLKQPGG